jgi:hypothetical protein
MNPLGEILGLKILGHRVANDENPSVFAISILPRDAQRTRTARVAR